MSKERAERRAEREAAAAREKEHRATERAARERRAAREKKVRDLVPERRNNGRPLGILEQRRKRRIAILVAMWALVQVFNLLLVPTWAGKFVVAALTAFALPVIYTLIWDRR